MLMYFMQGSPRTGTEGCSETISGRAASRAPGREGCSTLLRRGGWRKLRLGGVLLESDDASRADRRRCRASGCAAVVFGAYGTALALVGTRLEILPLQLYSLISETGSDFPAAAALALLITAACSAIMTAGAWFGSRHEKHL
jgi:hypothetical protein